MQGDIANSFKPAQTFKQEAQQGAVAHQAAALEELDLDSLELVGGGATPQVDSPKNGW